MAVWSESAAELWSPRAPLASSRGCAPLWILQSDRTDDNARARAIGLASGLAFQLHHVMPAADAQAVGARGRFDPVLLDPKTSSTLEPPWPDVIVAAGPWPVAVALWIRRQTDERTKVVAVGSPKAGQFDEVALIVSALPDVLPRHRKIIQHDFLPSGASEGLDDEDPAQAPGRDSGRPVTALLVGGDTTSHRLGAAEALRLGTDLAGTAAGGTLIVVTSPGTDRFVGDALRAAVPRSVRFVARTGHARDEAAYRDLLRTADRFVVTGDSVPMLLDVARLGRPLAIYPLARAGGVVRRALQRVHLGLLRKRPKAAARPLRAAVLFLHRKGLLDFPCSIECLHERLIERGLAVRFGDPFPAPSAGFAVDLRRAGMRIRRLVEAVPPPRLGDAQDRASGPIARLNGSPNRLQTFGP